MLKLLLNPVLLSCAVLLAPMTCLAQNEGRPANVRFLSFPKASEPVKLHLLLAGEKTLEIEVTSNQVSASRNVNTPGYWSVGHMVEDAEGGLVYQSLGRANLINSPQQLLLIIRKGAANADGFELRAVDVREAGLGGGKFLFMNASNVDIAGVVGERQFAIKPGQHTIVEPKPGEDNRTFHTELYFRKDGEARPFFTSRWPWRKAARSMVFFYNDPTTQQLSLHSVRDFKK